MHNGKIAVPLSSLEFVISLPHDSREDDDLCHLYYHPERQTGNGAGDLGEWKSQEQADHFVRCLMLLHGLQNFPVSVSCVRDRLIDCGRRGSAGKFSDGMSGIKGQRSSSSYR